MLEIISHRGICDSDESSLTGIKNCIKYNFGVELDIRIKHNDVYISHDVSTDGVLLSDACNIMDESKIRKIFHIKEIEALDNTIDILIKNNIKNFFLFNTENNKFSSGKNVTIVPVCVVCPIFSTPVVVFPKLYDCFELFPSLLTITVQSFERAFTTDTPTPCSPPDTL